MKRVNFNNFEQLTKEDLNNVGIFEQEFNFVGILKEVIAGGHAVITNGLGISFVSGDTLRIGIGKGIGSDGYILANESVSFDLLATNSQHDSVGGDGVPADVTNGNYFIVEIQFYEIDGAIELRNFIDPNGNTFSQTVVKDKILGIKSRIKEGNASAAPAKDSEWTKIAEVKKVASGSYTIYNVDSVFNTVSTLYYNTGWTVEEQITVATKSVLDHRSQASLDHPSKSVSEGHLTQAVQDKLNASIDVIETDFEYDEKIVANLLNKAPGESRNNKSLEYFFGTGLDTDYYMTKVLTDMWKDNLSNDDADATTVDPFDVNNPGSQQTLTNLLCDITTSLFDIWLDTTKVMISLNNDYDWTVEISTINDGLISLRPQTTWGAFKSGNDSANAVDLKVIEANDGSDGLEQGGGFVHINLLFQKAAFDRHFQGTALNIVITKDGQVYKWDGTSTPDTALTEDNFVYGYEMFLQPSEDGGTTAKSGTTPGENDAGWDYRKIATNQHRVYTPENFKLFVGKWTDDCITAIGYKYYDQFGSKLYQMKTQVVMREGFLLEGFHRFVSIIKFDETETEWADWARFGVAREVKNELSFTAAANAVITLTAHGLTNDDYIQVLSSTPSDIPIGLYRITYISADTFSINYDTTGGSGGVCKIVLVDKKNIVMGSNLSLFSESTTTTPVQVAGARDGAINIFDIDTGTTYGIDGDNENKNLEVHEESVYTDIDVSAVSRENQEAVAERSIDNATDIDHNEEEIIRLKRRLSASEIKVLDLQMQTWYLSQRRTSSPDFLMEAFFNKDQTADLSEFTNEVDVMDETDFNNNWKERAGVPDFKNGFIRNKKQPYMLEVIDKYNLKGIGQANKCAISSYDSTNDCYWMISNATGNDSLGEITKLSKTMGEGKVQILARYYIEASGEASHWGGVDNDGSSVYFIAIGEDGFSKLYKININSDGTLGWNNIANGETITLVDTDNNTNNFNTGVWNDIIIWDTNYLMLLLNNSTNVDLIAIKKSDFSRMPTSNITKFEKYIGGSSKWQRTCIRNGNDLWIKVNDTIDNLYFIYKFNITSDIISNVVVKASGRFKPERSVDVDSSNNEGITVSNDGDILAMTCTADAKLISRHALKNALWAENQVSGEFKPDTYAHIPLPKICMVEDDRYYWTDEAFDIVRYDTQSSSYKHGVITGAGWTGLINCCMNDTTLWILGWDGTNYEVWFGPLSAFKDEMENNTWTAHNIDITALTGWHKANGIGSANTKRLNAMCYNNDDNILYLINHDDDNIDSLSADGATWNTLADAPYTLPTPTHSFGSIAYKNNKIYIINKLVTTTPNYIFVLDKTLSNNISWYRMHIYQDPSTSFVILGISNFDFDNNDLVFTHRTSSKFIKMKVLEDPTVMQVNVFLDSNNILLSDNVSCSTPIVERHFDPEDFADIRDVPDKKYMGVGYGDEGMSLLHLDNFLSDRSSTGKDRRDVRKIRVQHYKNAIDNLCHFETANPTSIFIKKDMLIITGAVGASTRLIDLKSGKGTLLFTSNSGFYYNGSISERNDVKGWTGNYNSELDISSGSSRKVYARTFTKEDSSDYQEENPKTFVLIGTEGGCDILVIDWDSNGNRTPVKVWNHTGSTTAGRYAVWIAPSGNFFIGQFTKEGQAYTFPKKIWEVNNDEWMGGFIEIGSNILGGYAIDIAPNSRCWKTPSGEWRHQLICGTLEDTVGNGIYGVYIVDVENESKEIVLSRDAGVLSGYRSVDAYEDFIFEKSSDNTVIGTIGINKKLRFDDNWYANLKYNWTFQENITFLSRPRCQKISLAVNNYTVRYSELESILTSTSDVGLNLQLFPAVDQCEHKSINFSMSELKRYYNYLQTAIIPTGEKVTKTEPNDGNIVYTNGTTEIWSGSGTGIRAVDRDGGAQEGYLTWSSITGVTRVGLVFLKDDSSGGVKITVTNTTLSQILPDWNGIEIDLWYDEDATPDNGDEDYYTCYITIPNISDTFEVVAEHSALNNAGTGDHIQFVNAFTVEALAAGIAEATLVLSHTDHPGEEILFLMLLLSVTELAQYQEFTATAGQTEFALAGTKRSSDLEYIIINGGSPIYPGDPVYDWGTNAPNYDDETIDSNGYLTVKTSAGQSAGDIIRLYFNPKVNTFCVKTKLKQPSDGAGHIHHGQSTQVQDQGIELIC